jgi:hypothetical protein
MKLIKYIFQLAILMVLTSALSAGILNQLVNICPKWIWSEPIAFFIELLRSPLDEIYHTQKLIFFYIAGSIPIGIAILSLVLAFFAADLLYAKIIDLFKYIAEKAKSMKKVGL